LKNFIIKKINWDKKKHGLIWKCIDVFTEEELIYISKLIRDYIPPPPKEQTSFQGSELTTIRDRISPIVCNLYALFRQEYRKEGISVFAEEDPYRVSGYYKNNWNLKHGSNCSVEVHLQATAQGVNYRIHPDNEEKLLSLLVYISPEEQEPTYFHEGGFKKEHLYKEEDPDPVKTIPWKLNTGYVFLANDLSMHSYANTKFNTDRWVVLCTIRATK
tara:strand:- start:1806 stop:2453 length:648 start_codon:yes stop_codon:yes gene_type:complete